ncbi:hypothetical protein TPADAL_0984a [Treponema pallidum subsp. pallidum DAL-1]|uniref:Uncharacterized protein n=2 Tax=Treponema pallidum TaxID=160 RepID=A0AAU8SBE7_TREPL|nr:hypothetical protein TPESAMD_0984a [Treponema pallidum subsp. pertenue str. SamoaD]AEZ59193.1 hypothetical protein TPECDC2_0984a [Treponema pallidum subsp. pertenue str. CDC2]AEZ60261.1 hypothetical protein TPEGAU_0984a [Treponema pallidum subsp. pertenue str. Gauthier]AEZ61320.1 hypothetical protein TPADAL_0984a [Treponema pallidum subsp. pallidum DAL-1]AGK84644.1 hypothetical protein TPFB_0984a [Treponema pallidum str. Fribourg-Blanc]AHN67626.1 hypothetical protein TPSea814_000984a [Trepo
MRPLSVDPSIEHNYRSDVAPAQLATSYSPSRIIHDLPIIPWGVSAIQSRVLLSGVHRAACTTCSGWFTVLHSLCYTSRAVCARRNGIFFNLWEDTWLSTSFKLK